MAAFSVWVVRGRQCSQCSSFLLSGFPGWAERASGAGEPGWMPASGELLGARPACEGGIGGDWAPAWRQLGPPADYPCPEQCPVLVPGGRLGKGVAAALHSISVAAGPRRCRRPRAGRGGGRRAAGAGRRLAVGPPAGRSPGRWGGGRAGRAREHALPARARLSEPGLQGAQLRVVRVLAQPVGLLCGQAQRVAGLGGTAGQQLGLGQQPERERAEL